MSSTSQIVYLKPLQERTCENQRKCLRASNEKESDTKMRQQGTRQQRFASRPRELLEHKCVLGNTRNKDRYVTLEILGKEPESSDIGS